MSTYERVAIDAPPATVVQALRDLLRDHGITEYAVVDHGHDMAAAGAPGFAAWTLIFGNPAAGAKLLAHDLDAAVDIPLRLAVVARASGGSAIVRRPTASLLGEGELARAFDQVLAGLSEAARERVSAEPGSTTG